MNSDTQNLILFQTPITFVTLLVDGMKDGVDETGQSEWIPFMIVKGSVIIGTPEYYIDKDWFHIPKYFTLNWDNARITKLVVNLDANSVRKLISSTNITLMVTQDVESLCLIPNYFILDNMSYELSSTSEKHTKNLINANIYVGTLEGNGVIIGSGLIERSYGVECYQGF